MIEIREVDAIVSCYQCGVRLPLAEMIAYEELNFCADCKPFFEQRLRENSWQKCPACLARLKPSENSIKVCPYCGVRQRAFFSASMTVLGLLGIALAAIILVMAIFISQ